MNAGLNTLHIPVLNWWIFKYLQTNLKFPFWQPKPFQPLRFIQHYYKVIEVYFQWKLHYPVIVIKCYLSHFSQYYKTLLLILFFNALFSFIIKNISRIFYFKTIKSWFWWSIVWRFFYKLFNWLYFDDSSFCLMVHVLCTLLKNIVLSKN